MIVKNGKKQMENIKKNCKTKKSFKRKFHFVLICHFFLLYIILRCFSMPEISKCLHFFCTPEYEVENVAVGGRGLCFVYIKVKRENKLVNY